MTSQFVITDHALERFAERQGGLNTVAVARCRHVLCAELEQAVLFGAQMGDEELYLLPCGDVAAVVRRHGVRIVKTVLAYEHAIANMQAVGVTFGSGHLRRRPSAA